MEENEVVEHTQEELDAAFEAGLNGTTEPAAEVPEEESIEETSGEESSDVQPTAQAAEEALTELGLPASQVKALLAKAAEVDNIKAQHQAEMQKIYGKLGDMGRRLQAPKGRKLSKDDFKSLNEGGYDDLSEIFAKDLSALQMIPNYDPEPLKQEIQQILANKDRSYAQQLAAIKKETSRELNTEILSMKHPDWQEKWASDDMKLWMNTQPSEKQKEIVESENGRFLAQKMDEFVEWRDRGKNKSQKRLERAVQPKGSAPGPQSRQPTEADAFKQGMLAAQRRLGIIR